MTIIAKHFDIRLNKWIHLDNDEDNQESLLQEKISNTLLERFLPDKEFSFGHMDTEVTAKQLENHPNGDKLLLSSKTRLLYGSEDCLNVIDQLCPDRKDRGAYGSIFLGGCRTAIDTELNVLVVDDANGDNGGVIDDDQAYRLTGDCYGQIADYIYKELTGHQDGDKYRVIQHRFGWTPEDGNDDSFRFGKGTFRPANLDESLQYTGNDKPKIDVIIPISSFKGTDKDNPDGATKPQIKPGLYKQKIWIGEKSQSELGKTAISQVIASFPKGVKDFTERIELEAQKLAEAEKDPRKLAELYCEKYEKRKDYLENEADELENEISQEFDQDKQNNVVKLRERLENDSFIYKVIKEDLAGDCQLIETEKVKNELTKFVQGEWRDIAIGKKLQFERALVIPSKELNDGEIFIPKYNEGEEVLNFRSPFLNSNGMCVSVNKTVDDALAPDGTKLEGIIVVSDETSERIYNRLSKQVEQILPSAIARGVEVDGIENYLNQSNYDKLEIAEKINFTDELNGYIKNLNENGFDIKQLPYESEQEKQARDYDGDCIGFERASKYPNLTAEAIERNLPENAYEPTVKLKKASFYSEEGEQPSFETIAKHMSDGISVGIINNHLTSIEALESEMEVIKEYGNVEMQASYVIKVSNHYESLFKREDPEKESTLIPDKYRGYMDEVVKHATSVKSVSDDSQTSLLKAMDANKAMYRELIADAAYQNQIAVDLFKSATTPDIASINQNSRLLHRNVNYIKDKKKSSAYDTETIHVNGYSPVELLIAKTNQYFRGSQLESRPLSQFQDFFKNVEYTNQQRMNATLAKKEFDTAFNAATRFSKRRETEKGPSVKLKLASEKELDVSNLLGRNNQEIWNAKSINVRIIPVSPDKINSSKPHKFAVYAQVNGQVDKEGKPKFSRLGNISKEQEFNLVKETGIEFNQTIEVKSHEFQPALSEGQVKLLFNQAYDIATKFYESIPDEEKLSMAAATWAVSTTRESAPKSNEVSEVGKEIEKAKKVSNFVFAAFENEIIERTNELQLESTKVIRFNKDSAIFQSDTEVRYNVDSNGKDIIEAKNDAGEYETFAELEAQASRLPIGTTATAKAEFNEIYTATATTQIPGKPPVEFNISELIKYDLGQQQFNGEQVQLQIQCIDRAQEDYVIYTKDKQGRDIKVGKIDDNSVQEAVAEKWLERAPKQGQNLKLKLTQIASGQNGYAVGETPDGNAIRINLDKSFKENNIKDTDYRDVTMKAHGTKNVYMAAINGQVLGKIGVLPSKGRIPKSLDTLMKAGIVRGNQKVTTIPATIQSNQTTANVTLDKETIKYPEEWIKRHQILDTNTSPNSQEKANNEVLKQINTRPTLLFQDNKLHESGLLGLAIDENRAKNTKLFLDKKGIEYEEIPRSRAKQEARKGMVALVLNESSVSKDMMDILIERANGVILNNDQPKQDIPINPQQTVYFVDPNQEYGEGEKGVIGFVVPNKNVEAVGEWLNSKNIGVNYIDNDNTTIVLATAKSIESDTINELNQVLGTPIDTSTVEGFDKYEADSKKLNETKVEAIALTHSVRYNEYQSALKQLPNRPKNLAEEEVSQLPFAPASPLNSEPTKVQIEVEDKIANQAPINEKAEVYRLIQNDRANMPPESPSIDIIDSTMKPGIIVNLESHKLLNYNQQSTVLAVDFKEIEKTRNLLQDKSIEFDEAIGINYVCENVDPLTKLMSEKGYYTFVIKNEDVSPQDLNEINSTANVQHNFDIYSDNLFELEGDFKEFVERLPNADEHIKTAISQYIENKDLFLDEWDNYIKSNTEQYINVQHPPTKNIVELIEKVPSLSQEELNIEAAKLNIIEAIWVKIASESNKNVPNNKESQEWDDFVKEAFVDSFDTLASRSEYSSSVGVEKVKQIIQLEKESSQSLNGEVLEKVDELKRQVVESYGENSYNLLENKARKQIEKNSQSIAQLKFKGIHDNSNNQNYGGVEIENDNKLVGFSQKLGEGTSQQAEYQALIFGLEKAKEIGIANINISSDSQNTILQLEGKNQVKSEGLKPLYDRTKELLAGFDVVRFEQLPKVENEWTKRLAKSSAQEDRLSQKVSTRRSSAVRVTNNISENNNFNEEQKEAYQKIVSFLQHPKNGDLKKNEFLLTGYAGTGKTYTLIKTLEENRNLNICFTAPTNSAVKVLRKMSSEQHLRIDSRTTHSLLGLKEKYDKTTGEVFYDKDKKSKGREKFLDYDAIVVDEGSMVNKQLREKLEEVAQRGVKVIYMGDIAQLPPVNEKQSLIFDIEDCANLKQVMRYGGDIARIAEAIRNDLDNPNPSPILS